MGIIINSKFNPFTYAELTAPMKDYREAYDKVEADYSNLVALAEAWADTANRENNPEAFEMWRNYSNRLSSAVADFSRGMTISNRRNLLGLKRDYAREIVPIANAATARKEALEYRDKVRALDNTAIFEYDLPSVDSFLHGNTVSNNYVSGKDLSNRIAVAALALSKEYKNNPEALVALGDDFYEYVRDNGFSSEAILQAITGKEGASEVLLRLIDDAVASTGINKWEGVKDSNGNYTEKGLKIIDQVMGYINEGLWQATGTSQAQLVQNWRAQSNLQYQHLKELQESQQRHAETMFDKQKEHDLDMLGKKLNAAAASSSSSSSSSGTSYRNQLTAPIFIGRRNSESDSGYMQVLDDDTRKKAAKGKPTTLDAIPDTPMKDDVLQQLASILGVLPLFVTLDLLYKYGITLVDVADLNNYYFAKNPGIIIEQADTKRSASDYDFTDPDVGVNVP